MNILVTKHSLNLSAHVTVGVNESLVRLLNVPAGLPPANSSLKSPDLRRLGPCLGLALALVGIRILIPPGSNNSPLALA
jgi:hypothetical protein